MFETEMDWRERERNGGRWVWVGVRDRLKRERHCDRIGREGEKRGHCIREKERHTTRSCSILLQCALHLLVLAEGTYYFY